MPTSLPPQHSHRHGHSFPKHERLQTFAETDGQGAPISVQSAVAQPRAAPYGPGSRRAPTGTVRQTATQACGPVHHRSAVAAAPARLPESRAPTKAAGGGCFTHAASCGRPHAIALRAVTLQHLRCSGSCAMGIAPGVRRAAAPRRAATTPASALHLNGCSDHKLVHPSVGDPQPPIIQRCAYSLLPMLTGGSRRWSGWPCACGR